MSPSALERFGVTKGLPLPDRAAVLLDQTPPERRTKDFEATLWVTRRKDKITGEVLGLNEFKDSLARVSGEGDIYYPLSFKDRSWIVDPDLYMVCSSLPNHTSFRYATKRLPITEIGFTRTDGRVQSLEIATSFMGIIEEKYRERAIALNGVAELAMAARQATDNLQTGNHGGSTRFCEQVGTLYDKAIGLIGAVYDERRARFLEERLKKDKIKVHKKAQKKEGLKQQTSRDGIARILLGLELEIDRVRKRQIEAEFLSQKLGETNERLIGQSRDDRKAILGLDREFSQGSDVADYLVNQAEISRNQGFLLGKLSSRIRLLEMVRLKPYKQVAEWMSEEVKVIWQKIEEGDFIGAQTKYQEFKASIEAKKAAAKEARQ